MYNIRVVNLSLGRAVFESYTLDPLCQAAEKAYQAGLVVVVAANNYGSADSGVGPGGYGSITAPGNDPYVKDPADRIIGGTALTEGRSLITADRHIISSGEVAAIW